jgi:K+/H+ antiporter YhaU regulatory subunit KhtT
VGLKPVGVTFVRDLEVTASAESGQVIATVALEAALQVVDVDLVDLLARAATFAAVVGLLVPT